MRCDWGMRREAVPGEDRVDALVRDAGADSARGLSLYHWQAQALLAWQRAGHHGIVAAVTGAGKTRVGIATIDRHMARWRRVAKAVVLVPTIELAEQWSTEIARALDLRAGTVGGGHNDSLFDCDVLVAVINSAVRSVPEQVRLASSTRPVLLVADECHRYGAETFSAALDAPFAATIGLSATPQRTYDRGMEDHVIPAIGDVVFELTYEAAIQEGVIVDFDCSFVGLDFTASERGEYDDLSDRIATTKNILLDTHPELELSDIGFFAAVTALARDDDPSALAFLAAVARRRQVLLHAKARVGFITWLVSQASWSGKAILFHERIDQCDELVDLLADADVPAVSHHSALGMSARREALKRFASGATRAIVTPKTLDEGIDVPDADVAIIVAGSTVRRQRIQRIGRVLRTAAGKERARVLLLYVRRTREDPNQLGASDGFAEEMEKIDRASWFRWPLDGESVLAYLRDEFVARSHRPPRGQDATRRPPAPQPLTDPVELPPTEGQLWRSRGEGIAGMLRSLRRTRSNSSCTPLSDDAEQSRHHPRRIGTPPHLRSRRSSRPSRWRVGWRARVGTPMLPVSAEICEPDWRRRSIEFGRCRRTSKRRPSCVCRRGGRESSRFWTTSASRR